ncbi:MAG: hypothetical protein UHU21_07390 [Lachnospiraceae bacterium]|nr:hypothetical protein [Lachnospiraceae bacterium]
MAKIEIETLTDDCCKACDDFDVVARRLLSFDGKTYYNIVKCSNVDRCRIIKQHIESLQDNKGGDTNAD